MLRLANLSLKAIVLTLFTIVVPSVLVAQPWEPDEIADDRAIFERMATLAVEENLVDLEMADLVVRVGQQFLGTPYKAHVLEQRDPEKLVVFLRGFDCVTLIENVLALSRCVKMGMPSFDTFAKELQRIRYREGILDGYPSRLHYFSEWIVDNERKGIVRDASRELGGTAYTKTFRWMSAHRSDYPQLQDDRVLEQIRRIERTLSNEEFSYVPRREILKPSSRILDGIRSGDIIALTSGRSGLDVAHAGIAVRTLDGELHLLHASRDLGEVHITRESFREYLIKYLSFSGVMVARPQDMLLTPDE